MKSKRFIFTALVLLITIISTCTVFAESGSDTSFETADSSSAGESAHPRLLFGRSTTVIINGYNDIDHKLTSCNTWSSVYFIPGRNTAEAEYPETGEVVLFFSPGNIIPSFEPIPYACLQVGDTVIVGATSEGKGKYESIIYAERETGWIVVAKTEVTKTSVEEDISAAAEYVIAEDDMRIGLIMHYYLDDTGRKRAAEDEESAIIDVGTHNKYLTTDTIGKYVRAFGVILFLIVHAILSVCILVRKKKPKKAVPERKEKTKLVEKRIGINRWVGAVLFLVLVALGTYFVVVNHDRFTGSMIFVLLVILTVARVVVPIIAVKNYAKASERNMQIDRDEEETEL